MEAGLFSAMVALLRVMPVGALFSAWSSTLIVKAPQKFWIPRRLPGSG